MAFGNYVPGYSGYMSREKIRTYYASEYLAQNGHLDAIKYMVSKNNFMSYSAIEIAAEYGHLNIVKYLVSVNGYNTTNSFLMAIRNNRCIIIQYLLDINICDLNHCKIDSTMSRICNFDMIKLLIDNGVCIYDDGELIYAAAESGNLDTVKLFIKKGYGKKIPKNHDSLSGAVRNNHLHIIKYLVEKKYYISDDSIKSSVVRGHTHIFKYLINSMTHISDDLIGFIISNGKVATIRCLFDNRKIKRKNQYLNLAIHNQDINVVNLLIEYDMCLKYKKYLSDWYLKNNDCRFYNMMVCIYKNAIDIKSLHMRDEYNFNISKKIRVMKRVCSFIHKIKNRKNTNIIKCIGYPNYKSNGFKLPNDIINTIKRKF